MDIHGDLVYSQTGYDVIYFQSTFLKIKKRPKMTPPMAFGRILVHGVLPATPVGGLLVITLVGVFPCSHLSTTGTRMPNGITQFYLPPDTGNVPAIALAEAVTPLRSS